MAKPLRNVSREDFSVTAGAGGWDVDIVMASAAVRIADAMEMMAKNHTELVRHNDYLKQRNRDLIKENETLRRSAPSYKGKMNHEKKTRNARPDNQ